jgi:hypothetical protein
LNQSKPEDPFASHGAPVARTGHDLTKYPKTNRPQWAMAYMEHIGWSRHQAAAIIAHGMWESGGHKTNDIITTALGGEGSHGAWQWRKERYVGKLGLLSFALSCGRSSADLEVQLLFVDKELNSTEGRAGRLLKEAKTLEEAVEAVMAYLRPRGFTWENPRAGHAFEQRLEIARGLMKWT